MLVLELLSLAHVIRMTRTIVDDLMTPKGWSEGVKRNPRNLQKDGESAQLRTPLKHFFFIFSLNSSILSLSVSASWVSPYLCSSSLNVEKKTVALNY